MASSKIYNAIPDATLVCSIILANLLDIYFPVVKIIPFPVNLLGWLVAAAGLGLAVYIIAMLRSKRTSTNPDGVPSEFIKSGAYSYSRNPFYLLYVIVLTGVAFALGSLTAFVAPVACFLAIHFMIIPLEEKNLLHRFGQEYTHYKKSVRRWI